MENSQNVRNGCLVLAGQCQFGQKIWSDPKTAKTKKCHSGNRLSASYSHWTRFELLSSHLGLSFLLSRLQQLSPGDKVRLTHLFWIKASWKGVGFQSLAASLNTCSSPSSEQVSTRTQTWLELDLLFLCFITVSIDAPKVSNSCLFYSKYVENSLFYYYVYFKAALAGLAPLWIFQWKLSGWNTK